MLFFTPQPLLSDMSLLSILPIIPVKIFIYSPCFLLVRGSACRTQAYDSVPYSPFLAHGSFCVNCTPKAAHLWFASVPYLPCWRAACCGSKRSSGTTLLTCLLTLLPLARDPSCATRDPSCAHCPFTCHCFPLLICSLSLALCGWSAYLSCHYVLALIGALPALCDSAHRLTRLDIWLVVHGTTRHHADA